MVIILCQGYLGDIGLYVFLPGASRFKRKSQVPSAVPGAAFDFVWFAGAQVFQSWLHERFLWFSRPEAVLSIHPLMYLGYALMIQNRICAAFSDDLRALKAAGAAGRRRRQGAL